MQSVADATFDAIARGYQDPRRLELYLARVALDHGGRALAARRAGDDAVFAAHLRAYGQIARGLIETGYWVHDGRLQVGWGFSDG